MKGFTIKKLGQVYELENFDDPIKGFHYKIKKTRTDGLKIKEIIIVSPDITTILICHNFNKKYQKLIEYLLNDEEEGANGTNLMIALDEVARLRTMIMNKYKHFLKKKEAENLLKELKILENEIRVKIIDYRLIKAQELTTIQERGKSR